MNPFILIVLLLANVQMALARPARLILLRHAEKPLNESDPHLSEQGKARAQALVPLLTTNLFIVTNGQPVALFAPQFTPHGHGRRPYETLEPLAEHLNLLIQRPFGSKDYAALARHVLEDPALDGKTVIVCWVHDYIPALAKEFGVRPKPAPWKNNVYDRVWVITYHKNRAVMASLPQKLLPGDSRQ